MDVVFIQDVMLFVVFVKVVAFRVRPHRRWAAAAVHDLVTPDRARQLRVVQSEEKPCS